MLAAKLLISLLLLAALPLIREYKREIVIEDAPLDPNKF
jgi:hypothetical protein